MLGATADFKPLPFTELARSCVDHNETVHTEAEIDQAVGVNRINGPVQDDLVLSLGDEESGLR